MCVPPRRGEIVSQSRNTAHGARSTPPMTLNMTKQAQRPCQSERRSSGAARGDYEACVPYENVWVILVAAWKTISPREAGR